MHDIIARFQIVEGIITGGVGGRCGDHRHVRIKQAYGDIRHEVRLIHVLHVVHVGVIPDVTAERRQFKDAGVGCRIILVCHERDRLAIRVCRGEPVRLRQFKIHDIIARFQIGEGVGAGCVGGRLNPPICQGHRDTGDAGLTRILGVVRVGVVPDLTVECHRPEHAGLGCQHLIPRPKREGHGSAVNKPGELVPIRRYEFHDIIARFLIFKGICAGTVGGRRATHRHVVCRIQQVHGDTGDAALTRILHGVRIRVVPDQTADTLRKDQCDTCIRRLVFL